LQLRRPLRSSGPYVGIEGGVMFPRDTNIDADVNFVDPLIRTFSIATRSISTTRPVSIST
jgi:hypothetical protein